MDLKLYIIIFWFEKYGHTNSDLPEFQKLAVAGASVNGVSIINVALVGGPVGCSVVG